MKHLIIILILSSILFSCKTAKETVTPNDDEIELSDGTGVSSMEGGSYTDPLGAQVSVEVKLVKVNKSFSFGAGLSFSFQGANYKDNNASGTIRTSYLGLPILYTYQSNGGFYGEIGVQPALLLSAKDRGKTSSGAAYDDNYKYAINKFDLGIPAGTGYKFKSGFGIGVRLTYGLTKVDKSIDEKTHNLLVVGLVSYQFNCHKKKSK